MLHRKSEGAQKQTKPTIDVTLLVGLENEQDFQVNFNRLCTTWLNSSTSIPDCEGKRFVQRHLFNDLKSPLKISIIADDVEAFKKHYKDSDDVSLFELSCICGSEKIIKNFFLVDVTKSSCLTKSENAIAYAASSGKSEFTLELAKKGKELGRTEAGPVALYAAGNLFFSKSIIEVFSTNTKGLSLEKHNPFIPQQRHLEMKKMLRNPNVGKRKAEELLSIVDPILLELSNIDDKQQLEIFTKIIVEHCVKFKKTIGIANKLTP